MAGRSGIRNLLGKIRRSVIREAGDYLRLHWQQEETCSAQQAFSCVVSYDGMPSLSAEEHLNGLASLAEEPLSSENKEEVPPGELSEESFFEGAGYFADQAMPKPPLEKKRKGISIGKHTASQRPASAPSALQGSSSVPAAAPHRPANAAAPQQPAGAKPGEIEALLAGLDEGFAPTLLKLIDSSGLTDAAVYNKAQISRQYFNKIKNDSACRPGKATVLSLCAALELTPEVSADLLQRAGYAFSSSSKFDVLVRFCFERGIYKIADINDILYEFDQPLLGSAQM